jgi:hypothetical protein
VRHCASRLSINTVSIKSTNIDLINYGQKKSIINIQDLGLLAASQHSVDGQPILRVIYRKFLFLEFLFRERNFLFLVSFLFLENFQHISGHPIP